MLSAKPSRLNAFAVLAFCGDHAATRPLISPVLTAEHDVDHLAVSIQDRRPHLEAETTVLLLQDLPKPGAEGGVIREHLSQAGDIRGRFGDLVLTARDREQGAPGNERESMKRTHVKLLSLKIDEVADSADATG